MAKIQILSNSFLIQGDPDPLHCMYLVYTKGVRILNFTIKSIFNLAQILRPRMCNILGQKA